MSSGLFIEQPYSLDELRSLVSESDWRDASKFTLERRQREYLSWRAIVRRELGDVSIHYNHVGAPVVQGGDIHLSVSHSKDYVAVCISKNRCAVDVESLNRNFERVAPRYITDVERRLSNNAMLPAVLWCAKEAIYKYSDCQELDFLSDITIESVDFATETVVGRIKNGEPISLSVRILDRTVAVYICD